MKFSKERLQRRLAAFRAVYLGPYIAGGAPIIALITAGAWIFRRDLHQLYQDRTALLPGTFIAFAVAFTAMLIGLWIEHIGQRRFWLLRVEQQVGVEDIAPPTFLQKLKRRMPDPLEWMAGPILRSSFGSNMAKDWEDSGFGTKASRYLLLMLLTGLLGITIGLRVGGPLIGLALAFALPLLPRQLVKSRSQANRRRFGHQIPDALDSIASGLAAGLSFPQAIEYASGELPDPIVHAIMRLSRRIALGNPIDESLKRMHQDHPEESLAMVVEGIALQRQFGGDLVAMLGETARLVRERVELEREVNAITTQGRLSGWVVAALVPVSAGLLLFSNPAYIDVLFTTIIGQIMVVFAILLQIGGWVIISRMVRIKY